MLGTKAPLVYGIEKRRNELEAITTMEQIGELEKIKEELCVENTRTVVKINQRLPTYKIWLKLHEAFN